MVPSNLIHLPSLIHLSLFCAAKKWCQAIDREVFLWRRRDEELRQQQRKEHRIDRRRRVLVLVNPTSGTGGAEGILEETLAPTLRLAGVAFDQVVTRRSNYAHDLLATEDLGRWSAIVVISGDGLLYEAYQGIFRRPDWREARRIPIGVVAGGSGNGLARTIAFEVTKSDGFFCCFLFRHV